MLFTGAGALSPYHRMQELRLEVDAKGDFVLAYQDYKNRDVAVGHFAWGSDQSHLTGSLLGIPAVLLMPQDSECVTVEWG